MIHSNSVGDQYKDQNLTKVLYQLKANLQRLPADQPTSFAIEVLINQKDHIADALYNTISKIVYECHQAEIIYKDTLNNRNLRDYISNTNKEWDLDYYDIINKNLRVHLQKLAFDDPGSYSYGYNEPRVVDSFNFYIPLSALDNLPKWIHSEQLARVFHIIEKT